MIDEKPLLNNREILLNVSDEELALRCKQNQDSDAFHELMKRYVRPIFNFIFPYVKTQQDAEDIVQDSFLKIWTNLDKYSEDKKFKPWLYTIARDTTLDLILTFSF